MLFPAKREFLSVYFQPKGSSYPLPSLSRRHHRSTNDKEIGEVPTEGRSTVSKVVWNLLRIFSCLLVAVLWLGGAETSRANHYVSPTELAKSKFRLPGDGIRNENEVIGTFCCTGETAIVLTKDGHPLGFIYFFGFEEGRNTDGRSVAQAISIHVSGLRNLADAHSLDLADSNREDLRGRGLVETVIRFRAKELKPGNRKSATAGRLRFTVAIKDAELMRLGDTAYFYMDSVAIEVGVIAR